MGLQRLELIVKSIFLSASISDPTDKKAVPADPLMIHAAVRSFLALVLGRRRIVWGGHPSITPMVRAACSNLSLDYLDCVTLYQSEFFLEKFPRDNDVFRDIIIVPKGVDKKASLKAMRTAMFKENEFESAVFIGGMAGITDEYQLLHTLQPDSTLVPLFGTGGVASQLALKQGYDPRADPNPTDFTRQLVERLNVYPSESRNTAAVANESKKNKIKP
jgi:hypothetical protein